MPGLFFELCLGFGRPDLVQIFRSSLSLNVYLEVFIALFCAFVLGNALMFFVWVLRHLVIGLAYRLFKIAKLKMLERLLLLFNPKPGKSPGPVCRLLHDVNQKRLHSEAGTGIQAAWRRSAAQLLRRRYGITPPNNSDDAEWTAWADIFGTTLRFRESKLALHLATHATGWSGLAVAYFAPTLRIPIFLGFSSFMIFVGILTDWMIAEWLVGHGGGWVLGVSAILQEMPRAALEQDVQKHTDETKER